MSLSTQQLAELKTQLQQERRRILGNIDALRAEFGTTMTDDSGENGLETHLADQGTLTFLRERDLSLEEHEEHMLMEIDAALERIDQKSYGTCEIDGQPIAFDRLQALPWARTHLEHAPQ